MNRRIEYKTKRKSKRYGYRVVLSLLVVGVLVGIGTIGYQYHHTPARYPALQAFSARLDTWWVERKARIQIKLDKSQEKHKVASKSKAKPSSTPEPIHFEFYTMLPNGNTHANSMRVSDEADTSSEKSKKIFSSDSLEREFAKEITKSSYVVHTGMFSNLATAEKTRDMLAKEGLATKVIKAYMDDHLVYRVQMGPYEQKEQVNEVQSKLAARGLHATVHKIGEMA